MVAVTNNAIIATAIINMWQDDARGIARHYHRIVDRHGPRLLLGVGLGHRDPRHLHETVRPNSRLRRCAPGRQRARRGDRDRRPGKADTDVGRGEDAGRTSVSHCPRAHSVCASNAGRRRLPGSRAQGRTDRGCRSSTKYGPARGAESLPRPAQLHRQPATARIHRRRHRRIGQRRTHRRPGRPRLPQTINAQLDEHLAAGADHVGIQIVAEDPTTSPVQALRVLAEHRHTSGS